MPENAARGCESTGANYATKFSRHVGTSKLNTGKNNFAELSCCTEVIHREVLFGAKPATTFPRAGWLAGGKSRLRGCRGRGSRESGKPSCAVSAECTERGFSCVTSSLRCLYMREAQLVAAVGVATGTIALSLRECVPLLLCYSV
jgi:hypothetical protein